MQMKAIRKEKWNICLHCGIHDAFLNKRESFMQELLFFSHPKHFFIFPSRYKIEGTYMYSGSHVLVIKKIMYHNPKRSDHILSVARHWIEFMILPFVLDNCRQQLKSLAEHPQSTYSYLREKERENWTFASFMSYECVSALSLIFFFFLPAPWFFSRLWFFFPWVYCYMIKIL